MAVRHSMYKGYEILVGDDGTFRARNNDNQDAPITAETLKSVQEKIDRVTSTQKKSRKINLPVVTKDGQKAVITGVNLHTYRFTGLKTESQYGSVPEVYVDHPKIVRLCKLYDDTRKMLADIGAQLEGFKVNQPYGKYSRRLDSSEGYNKEMTVLEETYAGLLAKAEEL